MHISSSYAKILGETNFHTREFSQSGSKAKDGERKKEEDRKLVITMASYTLQRHLGWLTQSRLGQFYPRHCVPVTSFAVSDVNQLEMYS